MKLYYFNPNGYAEQAFVCAESKEEAIRAVEKAYPDYYKRCDGTWDKNGLNKMIIPTGKRTIDEIEPGQVVFSEIC